MARLIYKIVPEALWRTAEALAEFDGAPVDLADGYMSGICWSGRWPVGTNSGVVSKTSLLLM